jgi:hypothetical protein
MDSPRRVHSPAVLLIQAPLWTGFCQLELSRGWHGAANPKPGLAQGREQAEVWPRQAWQPHFVRRAVIGK